MPYANRESQRQAQATIYQRNKAHYDAIIRKRKREIYDWLYELKKTLKCVRCSENHPACLEFHHRDPSTKLRSISEMLDRGYAKTKILAEIDKCDVLCSNCHQKLHWTEWEAVRNANWDKRLMPSSSSSSSQSDNGASSR